jgi:hypothetical protein
LIRIKRGRVPRFGGGAVDHDGMAEDHVAWPARQLDHTDRHAVDDGLGVHEGGDPVGR